MKIMKNPTTNIQEVLYTLIKQGHVSIFDFPYLSGFRTRVSELTQIHRLKLNSINSNRCNKFGNNYTYKIHKLPPESKKQAINLYNSMQ